MGNVISGYFQPKWDGIILDGSTDGSFSLMDQIISIIPPSHGPTIGFAIQYVHYMNFRIQSWSIFSFRQKIAPLLVRMIENFQLFVLTLDSCDFKNIDYIKNTICYILESPHQEKIVFAICFYNHDLNDSIHTDDYILKLQLMNQLKSIPWKVFFLSKDSVEGIDLVFSWIKQYYD